MGYQYISWTCVICKKVRLNENISTYKVDHSSELNLPPGTFGENVKYCNDNPNCFAQAKDKKVTWK